MLYAGIHGISQGPCEPWGQTQALVLALLSAGFATSTCVFLSHEAPQSRPLLEGLLASIVFGDIKYLEPGPAENTSSMFLLLPIAKSITTGSLRM